jgi:hypothetical protein
MKNYQCLLLVAAVFFATACEKTANLTELTESDFYGSWERRYETYSEGIDSAHVSVDSIMTLINNGYDIYFNDGIPDNVYSINSDPTRQKVEQVIGSFFTSYHGLYDVDTALDVVSFQMENGKNIVRSQNLDDFNDWQFRTYHYPNGELVLQLYREDVDMWGTAFNIYGDDACYITKFKNREMFKYCDQDTTKYHLRLEAHSSDGSHVVKLRSLHTKRFEDHYFAFVR